MIAGRPRAAWRHADELPAHVADAIATGRVTLARTLARLVAGALLIWSLFNV